MEGLWQEDYFAISTWDAIPAGLRVISSRLVRRIKGMKRQSLHVLCHYAKGKPSPGGDLYAATPSLVVWRLLMALTSWAMTMRPDILVLACDVTKAFPPTDLDHPVVTTLPREAAGLVMHKGDQTAMLVGGEPVIVGKAQYGYRKSPRLFQLWLANVLVELTLSLSQVDSTLFFSEDRQVQVLFHVDDFRAQGSS